jgi:hypothetical protein
MAARRETHYETLGVARVASRAEIVRAFDRLVEEFSRDTTPPDAAREARIREAFAVLSDGASRAEYDRALDARVPARGTRPANVLVAAGAVAVVAGAALAIFLYSGAGMSGKAGRPASEIQAEVAASIGRVQTVDMAGKATATGIAFTVAQGVMATTCAGLDPGVQVVVMIGPRAVPARIAQADESLGLCKLAVDGAGSWPLRLNPGVPSAGAKVYAAVPNAAGDVSLAEGTVKRTAAGPPAAIEADVPGGAAIGGRPLLDSFGNVVGVATGPAPGGGVRHVVLPALWAEAPLPAAASPARR